MCWFEWIPYEDPTIRVVTPEEFFVNPNAWHVKVLLVVYTTFKIHKYDFLPTRDAVLVLDLTCDPYYMSWFRIHGKPYLLTEEDGRQRSHTSRQQWAPLNLRGGETGPSSAPTQESATTTSAPTLITSPSLCTI
ncbi:hypothetical protein Golob_028036 [Gossypium lobatum]|uniref:Uncharacterized protein n=1 Tax=Gossypium lobatum TaxID=34289 RepID=A0A7J8NE43_9ROSI|nr:hypothetical protein [Gossypium lobatum]